MPISISRSGSSCSRASRARSRIQGLTHALKPALPGSQIDFRGAPRATTSGAKIQPYIGLSWLRSFGANATLAREAGDTYDRIGLVAGLQLWW